MATPAIGDTVDVKWGNGRTYSAIVEQLGPLAVWLRVPAPIEITMIVPVAHLREIGPNRWAFGT